LLCRVENLNWADQVLGQEGTSVSEGVVSRSGKRVTF